MSQPNNLHSDGISFAFFDLLWSKSSSNEHEQRESPILRLPDTVLFLFGLPHQWYFTSKNGGPHRDKTTILRKRKANLTLDNIEDVFLTKASSRGGIGDDEVVAYFISSVPETAGVDLNADSTIADIDTSCSIEYFDKKTLRKFLHNGRQNKSGILQRFIAPHGGTHNSCIRAIWTPKMCITERRRTKQALYDKRFALYERAITFDGPDVHSVSVPLRGTVLAGRVESICNEIVKHITDLSAGETSKILEVGRMVVNFKVDGNGRIWILWSDSIRLQNKNTHSVSSKIKCANASSLPSRPLNMDTVVKLSSAVKLSQVPSHDTNSKLENKLSSELCPSCCKQDFIQNFHKVPYKTVIVHFEKTLDMLKSSPESHPSNVWPPQERYIKAAGNVGFGMIAIKQEKFTGAATIPPVIRHCHTKLQLKGYQMYRDDPLFLQKTCNVCEDCFLRYAAMKEKLFLMVPPVDLPKDDFHHDIPDNVPKSKTISNAAKLQTYQDASKNTKGSIDLDDKFDFKDFGRAPDIPPAILEPPPGPDTATSKKFTQEHATAHSKYEGFQGSNDAESDLKHMIDLNKKLASIDKKPKSPTNPYEEDLTSKLH